MEVTYNRLHILPIGKDKRLNVLREAIIEAQQKQEDW